MKKTLQSIFNRIGNLTTTDYGANDKGGQIHTYLETYDKVLEPYRNGCTFIEIGLAMGDSIKLFDEYFENSTIFGADISVVFQPTEYKNIVNIIEADATKPEFINHFGEDIRFDVVIDDGSHITNDQLVTFSLLKDRMNKGGIYIIEDILALDLERKKFEDLHSNCEIIDMRSNGRFDNVLVIYRF